MASEAQLRTTEVLDQSQIRRLLEIGRSLVSELDPEIVFRQVLEAARELTGAKYAALGVLGSDKRSLSRFLHSGIDEETRAAIGPLPRGHGILGELIRNPQPLRLARISDHPRSYGFPAHHPEMTTFAGVPITVRGEVYGNLYLAEKEDGAEFDERDEALLVVLADWAAVGIYNARTYEEMREGREDLARAVQGLQATASLSRELAGEADAERVVELIAKRGRALVAARTLALLVPGENGLMVRSCAGEMARHLRDRHFEIPDSPWDEVMRSRAPLRLGASQMAWFAQSGIEAECALLVPLRRGVVDEGVIAAFDPVEGHSGFTDDEVLLLETFGAAAAAAMAAVRDIGTDRLLLSIEASERERQRWARELHDETLQELGALKVLQESALEVDDASVLRRSCAQATERITKAIEGLNALITELRPAALDQLGAEAAIETLVEQLCERTDVAITTDIHLESESAEAPARYASELEAAVYRITQEALSNVVKHSGASRAVVRIAAKNGTLKLTVDDNGSGIQAPTADGRLGFGVIGMRERAEQLGGEFDIGSAPSGGTRVSVSLPAERGRMPG